MSNVINQRLLRELRVLAIVNHQNISPLLGISFGFDRPDRPCLVFPYYPHGEISGYLTKHPSVEKLPLASHNVLLEFNTLLSIDPDRANYQCFIISAHQQYSSWGYQSGTSIASKFLHSGSRSTFL